MEPPRSLQQRQQDARDRLESDADAWIASADAGGDAYLLPLSFLWDGAGAVVATPRSSVTGRNLSRGGRVRVGVGQLRDVTMIDGTAEPVHDERTKDAFAASPEHRSGRSGQPWYMHDHTCDDGSAPLT
jgi:Pyridoxamine 5'-phosphate oxidase